MVATAHATEQALRSWRPLPLRGKGTGTTGIEDAMAQLKPTKTVYTVSQFLDWQRSGILKLQPTFQRREVWPKKAKSMLIDTVVRGMPMPIIFLRKQQDLKSLRTSLEVIDGQQRLRTLLSYIDPDSLPDFKPERDEFQVQRSHNSDIAGKRFALLEADIRSDILEYEISTHVFPASTGDDAILRVFARLNSTGVKLNEQEIRNAQFFGEFKTLSYDLAFRNLERWRRWGVFKDEEIARMQEVETVSDYLMAMMGGIKGKSQPAITRAYLKHEDELPGASVLAARFEATMDAIDEAFGDVLADTRMKRQALFYSLFTAVYDYAFGLGSDTVAPKARTTPKKLPASMDKKLLSLNEQIKSGDVPERVADAMDKATADTARRQVRHEFFQQVLELGTT